GGGRLGLSYELPLSPRQAHGADDPRLVRSVASVPGCRGGAGAGTLLAPGSALPPRGPTARSRALASRLGREAAGQLLEVADVEIGRADARVRAGDEDAGEPEPAGGFQVVVRTRRDVIPMLAESRAAPRGHVRPDRRVGFVASCLLGADPVGQIEPKLLLRLPPVRLVAVRARDTGSDPHEASERGPGVRVERPVSDLGADQARRRRWNPEDVDEARRDDRCVGAVAAGFDLRLVVDHAVELG